MEDCKEETNPLISFVQYSQFDAEPNMGVSNQYCDEEVTKLLMYPKFKTFCYKFTRNLIGISQQINNTGDNKKCQFLNYWIHSELIKNEFHNSKDNTFISDVINSILELWKHYNFYNNCNFQNYKISVSDFKIMKDLQDYSENYSTIKGNISLKDTNCKKYYCSYIKKIVDLYKNIVSQCSPTESKQYCSVLKEIQLSKEPEKLYDEFSCSSGYSEVRSDQLEQFYGSQFDYSFTFKDTDADLADDTSLDSSSNTGLKVGFSFFGVSLICFFLIYKFTPLKNWFHAKLLKKIITSNNMDEEVTDEFLKDNEETEGEMLYNRLNIAYNPILTS
ncbi:PIR Superfamily Protein [Plasmodium ovale wallikeri]|uniref:Plasmodium vivax Vir protein, putative n=2 Tax=Plasmodium ovale TaxID=36330 RepID=A0A1C3KHJ3_PLAOA|nr:PIR Superfamily Protein [Plasmodium ovale wallikeri]SBT73210.1 Plasmodium vivax Vir protein, putative [Plasmodium ovale]